MSFCAFINFVIFRQFVKFHTSREFCEITLFLYSFTDSEVSPHQQRPQTPTTADEITLRDCAFFTTSKHDENGSSSNIYLGKSTPDAKETPVYEILESPYATADEITPRDCASFAMSKHDKNDCSNGIYSTINDGYGTDDDCGGDMPRPLGELPRRPLDSRVCETSFSESVYSSLNSERELDNNFYESLRRSVKNENAAGEMDEMNLEHERAVLASLPGIDSSDSDYVILC